MPATSEREGQPLPVSSSRERGDDERWNFIMLAVAIVFVFTICAIYITAA
jgi:hypothetical protein